MTMSERPTADPMPEPTPPGEWSCPICGQSFKSDCTYPVGRAPICGRDAVPMVPVNRAPEPPMPEPTPDRAVGEMSSLELMNDLVRSIVESLTVGMLSSVSIHADGTSEHRVWSDPNARYVELRTEVERRFSAATERPAADTVTMDRDTAVWAHRAASEMRRAVGEIESQLIWGKVEQNIKAALSAASDGGDCE